jgi:cytochrome c oxidase subunit IV
MPPCWRGTTAVTPAPSALGQVKDVKTVTSTFFTQAGLTIQVFAGFCWQGTAMVTPGIVLKRLLVTVLTEGITHQQVFRSSTRYC